MFKERFESAIGVVSEQFPKELTEARKEYAALVGEFYEQDDTFEERISAFLEWFFFDRIMASTGTSPLVQYLSSASLEEDDKVFFNEMALSIHSVFQIKAIKPAKQTIVLQDLTDLMRYDVYERRTPVGIETGDIIEARIFEHRDHFLLTDSILMHHRLSRKTIKSMAKLLRKDPRANHQQWVMELAQRKWFLERYPKSSITEVYKGDFGSEWFNRE